MLKLRNVFLFFPILFISTFLINLSCLSKSYANNAFAEDEENHRTSLQTTTQSISGYESLMIYDSDSEEGDLGQSLTSGNKRIQKDKKRYYDCCRGYNRKIPCWTEVVIGSSCMGVCIISTIITYSSLEQSTKLAMCAIGSLFALSGILVEKYQQSILGRARRFSD